MTTAALQDLFQPYAHCFGCGPANPDGIHLKSYTDGDDLVAEWVPEERFQGPPNVVGGGLMAVPMDCHSTWTAMHAFSADRGGEPCGAVTATFELTLHHPTPTGQRVLLRARPTEVADRHATVRCVAEVDRRTTAEFVGTYVAVDHWLSDDG